MPNKIQSRNVIPSRRLLFIICRSVEPCKSFGWTYHCTYRQCPLPGGIPLLKDIKPEIKGNQALQEEAIRKERRIELFAEGQRYFDVRRWMCADEEGYKQGGPVHGMNMNADNLEDFMERPHLKPVFLKDACTSILSR